MKDLTDEELAEKFHKSWLNIHKLSLEIVKKREEDAKSVK